MEYILTETNCYSFEVCPFQIAKEHLQYRRVVVGEIFYSK